MKLLLVPVIALFTILPGCWLSSACEKALPILTSGSNYAGDAEQAIVQLERAIANLPPEKLVELRAAIDKARDALRSAQKSLAEASTACSTMDIGTAFQAFVDAWDAIRTIVSVTALLQPHGAVAGPLGAAAKPSMPADPAIYLNIKRR